MPPVAHRLHNIFAAVPAPIRGAAWMIVAAVVFSIMNATIRVLSAELPAAELVFLRMVVGVLFMLPWMLRGGFARLQTTRHWLYLSRSAISFFAMLCWFAAVAAMPIAEATAVSFTGPIFAMVAAVLLLGEVVRVRRVTAMIVGMLGAMLVVKPGFQDVGLPQILALINAVLSGTNTVLVKQLTRTESASAIVTYMTLYTAPMALIPALFVWVTPSWTAAGWILVLGITGIAAHQALTRAFAAMEATLVTTFDYARLPCSAAVAWIAFGEVPDLWTWIGGAIIFGATLYIAHREAVVERERRLAAGQT